MAVRVSNSPYAHDAAPSIVVKQALLNQPVPVCVAVMPVSVVCKKV